MTQDFIWKDEYSVHVQEIDAQHKQLIGLINRLLEAINNTIATKELLDDILNELIKYTVYHFSTEEKYFHKFEYEFTEEHVLQHTLFAQKVTDFQKKFVDNEVEVSFELIDFLEDWLIEHICGSDQKYSKCFIEHGLT